MSRVSLIVSWLVFCTVGCNSAPSYVPPAQLPPDPVQALLNFSRVHVNTSLDYPVEVRNTNREGTIVVTGLTFDNPTGVFELVEPVPKAPFTLKPDETIQIWVRYSPVEPRPGSASMTFEVGTEILGTTHISGQGFDDAFDQFVMPDFAPTKLDILFIVDNSGSMGDDQALLAQAMQSFTTWLLAAPLDWQFAATTTDRLFNEGRFVGATRIITPAHPDPANAIIANATPGTFGNGLEEALECGRLALTEPNLSGTNAGFLRPDASLYVAVISDEPEQSADTVTNYVNFFQGLKTAPNEVLFGVLSPATSRYTDLVAQTNAVYGDIFATTYDQTLEDIATQITLLYLGFPLNLPAYAPSVQVEVDGVPLTTDGFGYIAEANEVVLTTLPLPPLGAAIDIPYEFQYSQ